MYKYETQLRKEGLSLIAGIDEAGRGPLAGPVVAATVILPEKSRINGIRDSKELSPEQRERLYIQICRRARIGIGLVNEREIDRINILEATRLAMKKAVKNLPAKPDYLLVDGKIDLNLKIPQYNIVRGDKISASVAAASIIAKVTRDRIMTAYDMIYPDYDFKTHKGYGTRKHMRLIKKSRPSPIHRLTFYPVRGS